MSRRRTNQFSDIRYHQLDQTDSSFSDSQFEPHTPPKIPWKAICLAILLCVGGIFMLVMGSLIVSGHLDMKYNDRMWPIIIIGIIMFIPGAYHVRIAYCAYLEYPGYSFDDIPEFE